MEQRDARLFDRAILIRQQYASLIAYLVKVTKSIYAIQKADLEDQFNSLDNKACLERFITDSALNAIFIQRKPTGGFVIASQIYINWSGEKVYVTKWGDIIHAELSLKSQVKVYIVGSLTDFGIRHLYQSSKLKLRQKLKSIRRNIALFLWKYWLVETPPWIDSDEEDEE